MNRFAIATRELLASAPKKPLTRTRSLEVARRRPASAQPHQNVASLQADLLEKEFEIEALRMANKELTRQLQTASRTTLEETIHKLREENNSLKKKLEAQSKESGRKDLAQKLSSLRSEYDRLRQERDALHREKEQQREQHAQKAERLQQALGRTRSECVRATGELEVEKKRIKQMETKACNSESCKNRQLRDINDTIGPKICIDQKEYSHSEALRFLVQREKTNQSEEVRSLKSQLQKMQQEMQRLREYVDRSSNAAGRCTRSAADCQRIREQMQQQGRSAAKDLTIMRGGEYDEPLEEFIEVFTSSDELLGVLESCLEPFEAKKVLCELFRRAYWLCKEAALQRIRETLEELFTVSVDKSRKEALGQISRAYGLLLHVSGLKSDESTCTAICRNIVAELIKHQAQTYNQAGRALQAKQEFLLKGVQVAWKFVTLPSPIIACQPKAYIPQIVEREYGYWDESIPNATLIYTRPVVYRCYDGNCAEKGMVANTEMKMPEQKKGFIEKAMAMFQS